MSQSPLDAARLVVRDYPGGAASLAPRLGKAASSLQHELDPNYSTAKLGLVDAVTITELTQDLRILNAFAAASGCMVLPLPELSSAAGECIVGAIAAVTRELSDYIGKVSETLVDGQVSDNELLHCERELGELIQAGQQLQVLLRARNQASKPDHERRKTVRRAADRAGQR